MKETKTELPYKAALNKYSFPLLVGFALFMAFMAKGIVFNGMFIGVMITIAVWIVVLKLPKWIQKLMRKNIFLSDLALTIASFGAISALGPGPTVVMASSVNACLFSFLLRTLPS